MLSRDKNQSKINFLEQRMHKNALAKCLQNCDCQKSAKGLYD